MPKINNVTLLGHLTSSGVDCSVLESGACAYSFSLKITDHWKDKSGKWQYHTNFIPVKMFSSYGEIKALDDASENDLISVEGQLKQERWETESGNRSKLVVNASKCQNITKWLEDHEDDQQDNGIDNITDSNGNRVNDDDLPF